MQWIVHNRLDTDTAEELLPFTMMAPNPALPGWQNIVYQHPDCDPNVFAIILVHDFSQGYIVPRRQRASTDPDTRSGSNPPKLSRSSSTPNFASPKLQLPPDQRPKEAPVKYHYPQKFIPMSLCTDGCSDAECPITRMPFRANQIVYILKSDEEKVVSKMPLACISAEGLLVLQKSPRTKEAGGFKDPLKRTGERLLSLKDDYVAYIVHDDSATCSRSEGSPSEKAPNKPQEIGNSEAKSEQTFSFLQVYVSVLLISSFCLILLFLLERTAHHKKENTIHTSLL